MRLLLTALCGFVLTLALGCGGPESSYQDREAAPGDADPSAIGDTMGGEGSADASASTEEGGTEEAPSKEAAP